MTEAAGPQQYPEGSIAAEAWAAAQPATHGQHPASAVAAGRRIEDYDEWQHWEVKSLTPGEQATSARDSAAAWDQVATTQDGVSDMPWFVTACRNDFMYDKQPPPGYSSYRAFLMVVVRPVKRPALGKVEIFIVDSDNATRSPDGFQDAALAPQYAAACLTKLARSVGSRPAEVQFMPLTLGRWTYTSACNLCDALAEATFPTTVVPYCFELPEDAEGSSRKLAVSMVAEGAMWRRFMEVAALMCDDIKEKLMERQPADDHLQGMLQGLTGFERGVPASIAQLRELFAASAEFRAAKPWQSFNCPAVSLEVQPLPHEVHGSLPSVFVMVTDEEHEERGCFIFESQQDLEQSYADMTGFLCRHTCLSFGKPEQCAFRDLDHYAELELMVAKDDELDVFPRWYEVHGPVKKRQAQSVEDEANMWNSAPNLGRWHANSVAMRAIAALWRYDTLPSIMRAKDPVKVTCSDGGECVCTFVHTVPDGGNLQLYFERKNGGRTAVSAGSLLERVLAIDTIRSAISRHLQPASMFRMREVCRGLDVAAGRVLADVLAPQAGEALLYCRALDQFHAKFGAAKVNMRVLSGEYLPDPAQIEALKLQGNRLFKLEKYSAAASVYLEGIQSLGWQITCCPYPNPFDPSSWGDDVPQGSRQWAPPGIWGSQPVRTHLNLLRVLDPNEQIWGNICANSPDAPTFAMSSLRTLLKELWGNLSAALTKIADAMPNDWRVHGYEKMLKGDPSSVLPLGTSFLRRLYTMVLSHAAAAAEQAIACCHLAKPSGWKYELKAAMLYRRLRKEDSVVVDSDRGVMAANAALMMLQHEITDKIQSPSLSQAEKASGRKMVTLVHKAMADMMREDEELLRQSRYQLPDRATCVMSGTPTGPRKSYQMMIKLLANGANSNFHMQRAHGDVPALVLVLNDADTGSNPTTAHGNHRQCQRGHVDGSSVAAAVSALLRAGSDPNHQAPLLTNDMRISALYFCASHGLEVPAQLLIDAGADLDTFNDEFSNPLHVASQTGHPKMVQLLIDAGALINARRPDSGSTPLITAAQKNRADVVALLIAAGAPLEDGVPNGNTALGVAVDKGWVESASLLLEAGANPQASFMYQGRKWTAEENARDELSRSDGPPGCDWRECIRLLQHHTAMRSMHGTPKAAQHVMKWSDEID